jgi:hypothetical protein
LDDHPRSAQAILIALPGRSWCCGPGRGRVW